MVDRDLEGLPSGIWRLLTLWTRDVAALRPSLRPAVSPCTCFDDAPAAALSPVSRGRTMKDSCGSTAAAKAARAPCILMDSYVASALELVGRAQPVASRSPTLDLQFIDLQALTGEVIEALEPVAQACGLRLVRDRTPSTRVCWADPQALYVVLSYLVLRTLAREPEPGEVRVMVTGTSREARVVILSRLPHTADSDGHEPWRELTATQLLLRSMAGALVLEPRRAGYSPLCIALRNDRVLPLPCAA